MKPRSVPLDRAKSPPLLGKGVRVRRGGGQHTRKGFPREKSARGEWRKKLRDSPPGKDAPLMTWPMAADVWMRWGSPYRMLAGLKGGQILTGKGSRSSRLRMAAYWNAVYGTVLEPASWRWGDVEAPSPAPREPHARCVVSRCHKPTFGSQTCIRHRCEWEGCDEPVIRRSHVYAQGLCSRHWGLTQPKHVEWTLEHWMRAGQ